MSSSTGWWSTFFTGSAIEAQRSMYPEEVTRLEADFLEKTLGLPAGAAVLDAPCGNGRLSFPLAERGLRVTGVDLTPDFIEEARGKSRDRGLAARFEAHDLRDIPWEAEFDGAFCFGHSFGYLDDEGNEEVARKIARSLRPGGTFVLDAPSVAEVLYPNLVANSWHQLGDILFLRSARHDAERGRLDVDYTFIKDGVAEMKPASYRIYTYRELRSLLERAGFDEVRGLGSFSGEPFRLGSPGLYVVAKKRHRA